MTISPTPAVPDLAGPVAGRHLRVWQFAALVVGYIVLVQSVTIALRSGDSSGHAATTSIEGLVAGIVVPVGLGTVLLLAVATWAGSWQNLFVESRRLARWTVAIPITLALLALAITHYSGLGAKGLAFSGLLLVATLMVGFAEELLFRGFGVDAFRWARASCSTSSCGRRAPWRWRCSSTACGTSARSARRWTPTTRRRWSTSPPSCWP